ncbi:hypothetical protein MPTK2_3g16120 [Marchantia polymorpha subsp. ruderalis]
MQPVFSIGRSGSCVGLSSWIGDMMDKGCEVLFAESVRRILLQADPNLLTESEVLKLAAEDTDLNSNIIADRKVVNMVIGKFIVRMKMNSALVAIFVATRVEFFFILTKISGKAAMKFPTVRKHMQ